MFFYPEVDGYIDDVTNLKTNKPMKFINPNECLIDLLAAGADITQIGENAFLVRDNGFLGLCEETDPFQIDTEDLIEMWEQYIDN